LFYLCAMPPRRAELAPLTANTPGAARQHNRHIILQALRRFGGLSRADLARLTGLTPQAIANIIIALMADGLVREAGRKKSARGQPPITIELAADGGYALGIRIDSSSYNLVTVSLAGDVLHKENGNAATQEHVFDLLASLQAQAGARHKGRRCFGVGIATPGPFDTTWPGVPAPGSITALQSFAEVSRLSEFLSAEVFLGNDAYAAAIGEKLYGAAKDLHDFFYLYIGEGVGGGLVIEGESYRGTGGNGGEAGHIIVDPKGKPCYCGNTGCLGQYLSLASLRKIDEKTWLDKAVPALRTAISTIENLFDPEAIILGGTANQALLQSLMDRLGTLGPSVRQDHEQRLRLSELGEESPALGAAALPLFEAKLKFN
jgi:predicted NBD/HSP70 family sugar kinase